MKGWSKEALDKMEKDGKVKTVKPIENNPFAEINRAIAQISSVNIPKKNSIQNKNIQKKAAPAKPKYYVCDTCNKAFTLKDNELPRNFCCLGCHIETVKLRATKQLMERLYIIEAQEIPAIARYFQVSIKTVENLLISYGFLPPASSVKKKPKSPVSFTAANPKTSSPDNNKKGVTKSSPDNSVSGAAFLTGWKQSWRQIGDKRIFARSGWEANFGRYLEFLKQNGKIRDWEHEPDTFWFDKIKRGVRSYLPDFKVQHSNGMIEYFEVKGFMDSKSKTKIKRMEKYHSETKLTLIDGSWFKTNAPKLKGLIPGWE
jgi:hypothetical protein